MQTIEVRYIGPTDTKGSRFKATRSGMPSSIAKTSVTVSYDYSLNTSDNHWAAAKALIAAMEWDCTTWHGGSTKKGMVFVQPAAYEVTS